MCSRPSPLPSVAGQHVQVALLRVWGKAACAAPVAPALPLSTRGAGAAGSLRGYWPVLHLRDTSQGGRSESTSTLTGLLAASVPGRKQVKHLTCLLLPWRRLPLLFRRNLSVSAALFHPGLTSPFLPLCPSGLYISIPNSFDLILNRKAFNLMGHIKRKS